MQDDVLCVIVCWIKSVFCIMKNIEIKAQLSKFYCFRLLRLHSCDLIWILLKYCAVIDLIKRHHHRCWESSFAGCCHQLTSRVCIYRRVFDAGFGRVG